MCRIFGFRSVIQSKVHSSLVNAENALSQQSLRHPDGWGVAYYVENAPHLIRSKDTALDDRLFQKVSGIVSSQTVIAHIRKATYGETSVLNTHPFQFGPWVFAHNGHIRNFKDLKPKILQKIKPCLKKYILGDTDSELLFYFLLTYIDQKFSLSIVNYKQTELSSCIARALRDLIEIIGDCTFDSDKICLNDNYLTFVLSNGQCLVGYQGGQPLNYSTYKKRCSERDSCPFFAPFCEALPKKGFVNHLIFSSEPTNDENVWQKMLNHQLISVDEDMKIIIESV